jgi:hypothetical protein
MKIKLKKKSVEKKSTLVFGKSALDPVKKKNKHSILSMQIYVIQSDLKEIFL